MNLKQQIIELRNHKYSFEAIANKLNCSKGTVSYHCRLAGISKPISQKKVTQTENLKETDLQLCLWLLNNNVARKDIADVFSLPYQDLILFTRHRSLNRIEEPNLSSYEKLKRRRKHLKMLAFAYMGGACCDCGYSSNLGAIEFHHLDPKEKKSAISATKTWSDIKKELDKCVMLCANCHRERHHIDSFFRPG